MLVIENDPGAPVGRLGDWLAAAGAQLRLCRPHAGDPVPDSPGDYQALVVLGGAMGAGDDQLAPWLPALRALLARALAEQVPTLGICLGAQLLAVAAGGRVSRAEAGEYGAYLVAKRQAADTDPLFRELPITPDVLHWHHDEVSVLPAAAVQLAAAPGCEQQAFRVGRLAWGLQFHIETTPEIVRGWAARDPGELAGYDVPALLERAEAAHPDIAEVWEPVARRFAELAADPDAVQVTRSLPLSRQASTAGPITDPAAIRAALAAELQAARGPLPGPHQRPEPGQPGQARGHEPGQPSR